jgi:sugar lactone lactonase YvrE
MRVSNVRAVRRLCALAASLLVLGSAGSIVALQPVSPPQGGAAQVVTDLVIEPVGGATADPSPALLVGFTAEGQAYKLVMRRAGTADGPPVYRGRVRGVADSWAWFTVDGGVLDGVIATPSAALAVVPASRVLADAEPGRTAAYRLAETPPRPQLPRAWRRSERPTATTDVTVDAGGRSRAVGRSVKDGAAPAISSAAAAPAAAPPVAAAMVNHQALAALGQLDLLSNMLNQPTAAGLFFPYDIDRDHSVPQTRMYVADTLNNRVLGYECAGSSCALATFTAATRVFGQPDFASHAQNGGLLGGVSATTLNSPCGVAVDGAGALYIADTFNNRVLVYTSPWSDATADVVIGQSAMNGGAAGSSLNQLRAPEGVFVDSGGALWVADTGNNRVLKFSTIATGASAAFAIGGSGGPSSTTLSAPRGVSIDAGGGLWVADTGFSRVLRYAPPLSAGKAASLVVGQGGSLNSGVANLGGVSAASLALPEKLDVDGAGHLWIADTANHRVLEYDTPLTNQTATRVYGQANGSQVPSFTTNTLNAFTNAVGMWSPRGLAVDANGTMWVCDRNDSRVMGYDNPLGGAPASIIADRLLGKSLFVDSSVNVPSANRMNNPQTVAVDRSRSPNRLWVADLGNNRVLGFSATDNLLSNRAADIVLGQTSFASGATNAGINGPLQDTANSVASAASFMFPSGVAVDSLGGVYVGDSSNSRVLHFADPFGTDTTGDRVFGQANFSDRNPSFPWGTASSLAGSGGVSIGPNDNLWVADALDHRVVRFSNAPSQPTTGASADLILGQSAFVSSSTFPPYSPGCAANRMNDPLNVFAAPSGRVYVADSNNNRVLVFSPPFSNGMNASAVFGQSSLTSCLRNRGGAAGPATLASPYGVFEDANGDVYIADSGNNRVLIYNAPFGGGDLLADDVLGQPDLTTTTVVSPGPGSLNLPGQVTADAQGRVFVTDIENSRVTRYSTNSGPTVVLDPISSPIVVGDYVALTGSGFTAGSRIKMFVATSSGPVDAGTFQANPWNSGILYWNVSPSIPLGAGFATVYIVNTDQGFIRSASQSQLLFGNAAVNIPTIRRINGVDLRAFDARIPVANVETVVPQGATVAIEGTGFNNPLVNLFTSAGNKGPLTPRPGGTATRIDVDIPADAPTGPGSFQVVNNPYTGNVRSNAVSVPIGAQLSISAITQSGSTITVDGTGFSTLSVINFFNGGNNLGGNSGGHARIPLTIVSANRFTFSVPAGAVSGPAYVQVINPPYIPFASTGNDPDGGFNLIVP